jgi:hypothetical protein
LFVLKVYIFMTLDKEITHIFHKHDFCCALNVSRVLVSIFLHTRENNFNRYSYCWLQQAYCRERKYFYNVYDISKIFQKNFDISETFRVIYVSIQFSCPSQWPLACWDCGFESHREHGSLSIVNVVRCQVDFSATS